MWAAAGLLSPKLLWARLLAFTNTTVNADILGNCISVGSFYGRVTFRMGISDYIWSKHFFNSELNYCITQPTCIFILELIAFSG